MIRRNASDAAVESRRMPFAQPSEQADQSGIMSGRALTASGAPTVHYQRRSSKERVRLWLACGLLLLDLVTIQLAFVIVHSLTNAPLQAGLTFAIGTVLPIYLICAFMLRAYSGAVILDWGRSVRQALLALATSGAVLGLVLFSLGAGPKTSQLGVALTVALAIVLIFVVHYLYARRARRLLGESLYSIVELCDGSCPRPNRFNPSLDTRFSFDPTHLNAASFDRLATLITGVDRVILYCAKDRRTLWANVFQGMNVHAELIAPEWAETRPLGIGHHRGENTIIVARGPLNLRDRIIKRSFDTAFSAVALILLSPLILAVAIAIKLDSPGPVFFIQPRIGRRNQLFRLIKFRSMRQDTCDTAGALSTCREDQRVTRIGNFIRRTSIDELPQLFNILKGDMSVVGPRPHAVSSTADNRLFWDIDNRYWHRHACRPGLTGLAQIQGLRGATACAKDLTNRVEADLTYLHRWSFWNDIIIILRTCKVVYHMNAF